jgi:deoxycytidylate deaminase
VIRIASREARKSPFQRHKLGAVIVKGGRVLSTGYNEVRYTRELRNATLHAEEAAILKLLKAKRLADLAGAELFVSRVKPSGNTGLSRCCDRCLSLIRSVGIDTVHYTNDDGGVSTLSL